MAQHKDPPPEKTVPSSRLFAGAAAAAAGAAPAPAPAAAPVPGPISSAAMPNKALVILLGSEFNSDLETRFKFISDLISNNFIVDVYSFTSRENTQNIHKKNNGNITVYQVDIFLDRNHTVSHFLQSPINSYEQIILIDGIDYRSISDPYKEALSWLVLQQKNNKPEIYALHYISHINHTPAMNLSGIEIATLNINLDDLLKEAIKQGIIIENKHKMLFKALLDNKNKVTPTERNIHFDQLLKIILPLWIRTIPVYADFKINEFRALINRMVVEKIDKAFLIDFQNPAQSHALKSTDHHVPQKLTR